jgi:quercetin dioxygenase-like cupin family protein
MKILPRTDTAEGSEEWFTGKVYVDTLKPASDAANFSVSSVHFTPGARAAWHSHPHGQTLYVTEGLGVIQRRGGSIELIRPGDVIWTEPGEEHWHGATATTFMTHIAIQSVDEQGNFADWKEHVTDEEYGQQPHR